MNNRKSNQQEFAMRVCILSPSEWSAKTLAILASIAACTTSAALIYLVAGYFFPNASAGLKLVAVLCSYMQLSGSTVYGASVTRRKDNTIEGWVYNDIGDDEISMTVRQWIVAWYSGALIWSALLSVFGLLLILIIIAHE